MAKDDESLNKKWQVTAWSGMSCFLQTRRLELYYWPAGILESAHCISVDWQPKVGNTSTGFFDDTMYEMS